MQKAVQKPRRLFLINFMKLALPIMAQTLMIAAMQVVDNVLVGQLQQGRTQLGEYTISGVAQANKVAFLFQMAAFGMAGGASAFFSQFWGKRDYEGVNRTLGMGVAAGLVVALAFAIPSILAPEAFLRPLLASSEALWYGAIYLRIVALSFFPYAISAMLSASFKSTERVLLPMFASFAGAGIDALASYVLIFGKFGAPRLEVAGAAAGSVLGVLAELLILLLVGHAKGYFSPRSCAGFFRVRRDFAARFLKVVLPVVGNEMLWALGVVAYSATYGNMENAAAATSAVIIYSNVEQMASVILRGTTQATAILIGMSIGAGREDEARHRAWRMLKINIAIAALTTVPILAFGGHVTAWFSVGEATKLSAQRLIRIFAFVLPLIAANSVMVVGIFRPGGDSTVSMLMDVVPMWALGVPLAFLAALVLRWDVEYVYLVSTAEYVAKAIFGIWRLRSGKWIHNLVEG
jgi:putative MATE family efflux protein